MTRSRAAGALGGLAIVAVASAFALGGLPRPATSTAAASAPAAPAARRMLVVSLPTVTWAGLPLDRMPNLAGLLEQSIVGDLSLRGVHDDPTLGDTYVTISAGTRAVGSERDGDAVALGDGSIAALDFRKIVAHNHDLLYDAHPGALGTALEDAGIGRAAIGNGGQVANALATPSGVTPGGDVTVGRDPDAYLAAFRRAWTGRSVVLVEYSDLGSFDHLLGGMLASVDPARDAVMVVGPTSPSGPSQLTVASLRAPGTKAGLAVSAYTRRAGFVAAVDIAPTILDVFHVDAPSSMEGRAFELGRTGGDFADRRTFLVDANRASVFRDAHVQSVTTAFLVAQLVLVVAAVGAFVLRRRAVGRFVELIALSLLGGLPAMFLAGLFPFDRQHSTGPYWIFLAGVAVAIGVGSFALSDRRSPRPLVICLAIIVGVLVVDVVTGAHLQLNTAFGYSPTVGGRFAGIGNLAYSELAAAALLLAALVAYRIGDRRGALCATALLGLAVVVDGAPIWGSDIGGVLSMVPAYAIAVTGLLGLRVRLRAVLIGAGATVLALGAAIAFDLSRPKDHQTHLGRLVSSTRNGGWHSFSVVVERKLSASLGTIGVTQWAIISPIVLAFLAYIVLQAPGGLRGLVARIPPLRPALLALAVLAVLGFGLNDSGIRIPAVMLGVLTPVVVVILLRADEDQAHV